MVTVADGEGTFGRLLQRHRRAAGLSQQELAERAGLSLRGLADLERGARRTPYPATVRRLVQALGLDEAARAALLAAAQPGTPASGPAQIEPTRSLPVPLSSFVGREREVAEVKGLLEDSRLLTLTGAGGIGKTRLALTAARAWMIKGYEAGALVSFVDLSPLVDPDLVPQVVAAQLGVPEQPGRPVLATLVEALQGQAGLLVLDNCEHLIQACAELADQLLRSCPELRILATSREPLGIAGETAWRVPPLSLPDTQQALSLDQLRRSEAVQLFVVRAAAVLPSFTLSERNTPAITQLCRRLDGIPLALELAAARVPALSVEQICERLDDALRLLAGGHRLAPARQQTLRAALDWSYGLLASSEQHLFDRLSIFAGGWTLEAAEAVCTDRVIPPGAVLDLLAGLVDKSLVACQREEDGPVRYDLLETLRQYGQHRLAERGEADQLRDRQADFFLALAERTEPDLHGRGGQAARVRLQQESDNLRAALRWLLDRDDGRAQRLAGALARFWFFSGHLDEATASLARALAMPGGDLATVGRAKCLHGLATLALARGDFDATERASREARIIWRGLGNRVEEGFALFTLASAQLFRGEYAAARSLLEEALAISRVVGHGALESNCLQHLAEIAYAQGDFAQARSWAEAAQARASEAGFALPLALARRMLGLVAMRQGDARAARALLEAGLAVLGELGFRWWSVWILVSLGELALEQGDLDQARVRLTEALRSATVLADRLGTARALEMCAQFAVLQEQPRVALRLVGAAGVLRRTMSAPCTPTERTALEKRLARAQVALGRSASEAAMAEGAAMSVEQAMSCALRVAEPRSPAGAAEGALSEVLTAREQEVAALVAQGLTNPQIAQALVVGERTVQTHVGNILAKLGLASRAQIAAWVVEQKALAAHAS